MSGERVYSALELIKSKFTTLDEDLLCYTEGILTENTEHFDSESDVYDAVGSLLTEVDSSITEVEIEALCGEIFKLLKPDGKENEHEELDAPIHMSSLVNNFNDRAIDNISIWMTKKESQSIVDVKKLSKAEAKIREKQKKSGSQLAKTTFEDDSASVSQQLDRRDANSSLDPNGVSRKVIDIQLENFDISYGSRSLLEGANLTISLGRRYGLVGRNGYGKTTFLRALARGDLRLPPGVRVLHVEQEVIGDSTLAIDSVLVADIERHKLLSRLSQLQGSMHSDQDSNSSEISQIYAKLHAIEAEKAPSRAARVLHGLGFTSEMQLQPTKEFSGGWRMRLALASALFSRPDLLLLDEPTNMLDMRAIIWLEDYLKTWPSILIVVSHDRAFLNEVATDIVHLTTRRLEVYRGNYEAFTQARAEHLLAQQRDYEAQRLEREHMQQFIDKFRFNAKRASLVQSRIKALERLPKLVVPEKEVQVVFKLPCPEKLSGCAIQLDEIDFGYTPEKPLLKRVDLSISFESRICIVGENGAGKTTLLKLLMGDLSPTKGFRHTHRALSMGYFSQHHVDSLELGLTSLEFLVKKFPGQTEQIYRSQLASFNITDLLAMQPIGSLSGGQKSRVAFAVMCMSRPNLLILDEPTNHLDMETIAALSQALNNFTGGVVLVTHDERLIESVCRELWVCTKVPTVLGTGDHILSEPTVSRVFSMPGGLKEYKRLVSKDLEISMSAL